MNTRLVLLSVACMLASSAGYAASLTGNYRVTVAQSVPAGGAGMSACVALADTGSGGWAHSGSVSYQGTQVGIFYVAGGELTVAARAGAYSGVLSGPAVASFKVNNFLALNGTSVYATGTVTVKKVSSCP